MKRALCRAPIMSRTLPLAIIATFLAGVFAGCLDGSEPTEQERQEEAKKIAGKGSADAVFPGQYRFDGSYSYTIAEGPFAFSPETPLGRGKIIELPSVVTPGSNPWAVNNP